MSFDLTTQTIRRRLGWAVFWAIVVGLSVLAFCTGCVHRYQRRSVPTVARAQAIAREQHATFVAAQRDLDAQASAHARIRTHTGEALTLAQRIDAKAQVILDHW